MGLFGFKSYAGSYMGKARKEYQEELDKIAKEAKEFYYSFNDIKESNDFKIFSKDEIKNILLKKREKLKLKNKETIEEEIILLKKELKKHNKKQLKRINAFLHKQFN
jgi:hypothetical protein